MEWRPFFICWRKFSNLPQLLLIFLTFQIPNFFIFFISSGVSCTFCFDILSEYFDFLVPCFLIIYSNFWIFVVPWFLFFGFSWYLAFCYFILFSGYSWYLLFLYTSCTSEYSWRFAFWYVILGVGFSRYFSFYTVLWFLFYHDISFSLPFFLFSESSLYFLFIVAKPLPPCWRSLFLLGIFDSILGNDSAVNFKLYLKIQVQWVNIIKNRYYITLKWVECIKFQTNCFIGTWKVTILIFTLRIR